MATCEFCGREMWKDEGCSYTKVKINDNVYNRIKCGAENDLFELEEGERCHDCGALVGHYHHPFLWCRSMSCLQRSAVELWLWRYYFYEVSLKMACKKISEKQGRKDTASPVKPNLWHQEDRTSNSVNTESKIQVLHDICFSDIAEETQWKKFKKSKRETPKFVEEFNKNKISNTLSASCKKAGKLFKKNQK